MSAPALLPDLPGLVHGLVSLDPPAVQCDGCGTLHSRPQLGVAVLTSGITFNTRDDNDDRRMCRTCWADAGRDDDNQGGRKP